MINPFNFPLGEKGTGEKTPIVQRMLSLSLLPASWIYGSAMKRRRGLYEIGMLSSRRVPCKVVSIGNLTVGGTGKTQVVSYLSREAFRRGIRGAVINGGYGGNARKKGLVVSVGPATPPDFCGDEAAMLSAISDGLPVYSGQKRFEACRRAVLEKGAALCILDDAAQHLQIKRDEDVFVMDADNPFGNGACLPAGPLREYPSAIGASAIIWLVSSAESRSAVKSTAALWVLNQRVALVKSVVKPVSITFFPEGRVAGVEELKGVRVAAFSGIARADRFFNTAASCGMDVRFKMPYPDHHSFTTDDAGSINEMSFDGRTVILTTAKDESRSGRVFREVFEKYAVLNVGLEILSGHELIDEILRV